MESRRGIWSSDFCVALFGTIWQLLRRSRVPIPNCTSLPTRNANTRAADVYVGESQPRVFVCGRGIEANMRTPWQWLRSARAAMLDQISFVSRQVPRATGKNVIVASTWRSRAWFNTNIFACDQSWVAGVELATANEPPARKPELGGWGRVGHSQRAPSAEASDLGRRGSGVEPSHPRLT
jgi:hypothetical protein